MLTFKLDTVPEAGKAHELAIFTFGEVGDPVLAAILLEPLKEALGNDNAAFLLLHGGPHAAIFVERVVAAIDRLQLGAIVGVALSPERYQAYRLLSEGGTRVCGECHRRSGGIGDSPHCILCSLYLVSSVAPSLWVSCCPSLSSCGCSLAPPSAGPSARYIRPW